MVDPEEISGLQAMFANANTTVGNLATEYQGDVAQLAKFDRLNAVSAFASMLILPHLQANAYRLETLVHLAVAKAEGRQQLSAESARKIFKRFGDGTCGRMEDPAEDLFASSVRCRQGNFTVFEGLREGNSFYLQRVLDILEGLPDRAPFMGVRRSIFALLALSDTAARRVGISPGMMGESQPLSDLPKAVLNHLVRMRKWVQFSAEDLQLLHIDVQDLSPFVFRLDSAQLNDEALANSSLERSPVLRFGTSVCLALPTSVGSAIILMRSFHTGETPGWQVRSSSMLKWLGHTNNVTRTAFNSSVSATMRDMRWKSEPDYRITKLLGFPLDRDYGDIDALAWHPISGRVLAIECKDLQFHKTLGEVAEQLSDFRGRVRPDRKNDLLRKHLDRMIVMEQHKTTIAKRLRLNSNVTIEGFVVFKNPVPMEFAWAQTQPAVQLLLADQLGTLRLAAE